MKARVGLVASTLLVACLASTVAADARVRREGQWPEEDVSVSLDVSGAPRAQALRKLADAAGWSLVVHEPAGDSVDVHVKGQAASKVLELLLDDGDYVARREGTLVSIERERVAQPDGAAADIAPDGSAAVDRRRARDRTVMGGSVHIRKGETAGDVTVFGGNLDVDGEVTGDVTVFGGNVQVNDGAHVHGDATVFGGRLALRNGSHLDGDVSTIGGTLERAAGAQVGGSVGTDDDDDSDHCDHAGHAGHDDDSPRAHFFHGIRLAAVLYVIGTILLALGGGRMMVLRAEMAARPMRSIALGFVGSLTSVVILVALCVTIIGIPIAVVAILVAIFAVLGAMTAVLGVTGEALLRHKTENPYVHLALGCALFVALSWIPWVGGLVVGALVLAGIGVLVATRCAGLLPGKKSNGGGYAPAQS
jgi:hypothetical protein